MTYTPERIVELRKNMDFTSSRGYPDDETCEFIQELGEALDEIERLTAEVARLKAVACESEPYVQYDFMAKDGLDTCLGYFYKERGLLKMVAQVDGGIDREQVGRLAATLAHFHRTGELPKERV